LPQFFPLLRETFLKSFPFRRNMNRDLAVELIKNFHEKKLPEMIEREFDLKIPESKKALALIGPRRAGKTYTLFNIASKLMKRGIDKEMKTGYNRVDGSASSKS